MVKSKDKAEEKKCQKASLRYFFTPLLGKNGNALPVRNSARSFQQLMSWQKIPAHQKVKGLRLRMNHWKLGDIEQVIGGSFMPYSKFITHSCHSQKAAI